MLYSQGKDMNSFVIKKLYFYWKLPQKSQLTFGICDGRIFEFRHAGTEVDFYFIVEDNIC